MNLRADANTTWKWYGENDPYYGVLSRPQFRNRETRVEFFATGEKYVESLLWTIRQHLDNRFALDRVLDFGCGVGRVLIPLAKMSSSAIGVDISPGMRKEALKNCAEAGLRNVTMVASVADAPGLYDFIHSCIVFQHIPVGTGIQMMGQLCQKLSERGVISVQFPFAEPKSYPKRILYWLRCHLPGINPLVTPFFNMLRGRPVGLPMMQMNVYPVNKVLTVIEPFCDFVLLQIAREGGYPSVNLIGQRRAQRSRSG